MNINNKKFSDFYTITKYKTKNGFREILIKKDFKAVDFLIKRTEMGNVKILLIILIFLFFIQEKIKINFLKIFLKVKKEINLGDIILNGSKTIIINFKEEKVYSFLRENYLKKEEFINSKLHQKKMSKYDISPKIFEINSKENYIVEQYISNNCSKNLKLAIKRLFEYYEVNEKFSTSYKKYSIFLRNKMKENKIFDKEIFQIIDSFENKDGRLYEIICHGDFSFYNMIFNDKKVYFIDLSPKRTLYLFDFISFFQHKSIKKI